MKVFKGFLCFSLRRRHGKIHTTSLLTCSEYIERHKEEGIIWFLEAFETNTAELQRTLWQMKSCGYFKYCKRGQE